MARDRELDRLTQAVEMVRDLRQKAYEAKEAARVRASLCAIELQPFYKKREAAVDRFNEAKQEDADIRIRNSPLISAIEAEREAEFMRMRNKRAAVAYYERMSNIPKMEQSEQERYLHECRGKAIANERQGLLAEIRHAREARAAALEDLRTIKGIIFVKRGLLMKLNEEYTKLSIEFTRTRQQEHETYDLHKKRRMELSDHNRRRLEERRRIAQRAGVPAKHTHRVHVVGDRENGDTNIYFGGRGRPDGPGHGHYVLNLDGALVYRRDPGASHGPHNFIANQQVNVPG